MGVSGISVPDAVDPVDGYAPTLQRHTVIHPVPLVQHHGSGVSPLRMTPIVLVPRSGQIHMLIAISIVGGTLVRGPGRLIMGATRRIVIKGVAAMCLGALQHLQLQLQSCLSLIPSIPSSMMTSL